MATNNKAEKTAQNRVAAKKTATPIGKVVKDEADTSNKPPNTSMEPDSKLERKANTSAVADKPPVDDKPPKYRLNLDLAPQAAETLDQLAQKTGKTKAEILRAGLTLYEIAQAAKEEDSRIAVVHGNEITKEILLV